MTNYHMEVSQTEPSIQQLDSKLAEHVDKTTSHDPLKAGHPSQTHQTKDADEQQSAKGEI